MHNEFLKGQFLGEVEYAAQFARLKPLLYSLGGHAWEGEAKREWFPTEGLVFSVANELKFEHPGSLWIFRVMPNKRSADGPDKYSVTQHRRATRLLDDLAPMTPEEARRLATIDGIEATAGTCHLALPETDDHWVVAADLEQGDDGLWRVTGTALKRVKAYLGTPESLCGMPTPDGRFALPPSPPATTEFRNWQPPEALVVEIAKELPRWFHQAPLKDKAAQAARALRDLAPHFTELAASRPQEAQAALLRAASIANDAEALTGAADEITRVLADSEPFKAGLEAERAQIREEMEELALAEAQALAGEEHAKLTAESDSLRRDITHAETRVAEARDALATIETELAQARAEREGKLGGLEAEFSALMKRVEAKPAKALLEWVAASGFGPNLGVGPRTAGSEPALETNLGAAPDIAPERAGPKIRGSALLRALHAIAPASQATNRERLEWMDAAVRARELPVLIGATARLYAEAWLGIVASDNARVVAADPTLLSLLDFTPEGSRGAQAPLARLFERCRRSPERLYVALLDDPDTASAVFWLPEFARALRQPTRHGFPTNLAAVCVMSSPPSGLDLAGARAADLFPLVFEDGDGPNAPTDLGARELPSRLLAPELSLSGPTQRAAALAAAAAETFSEDDVTSLGDAFRAHLAAQLAGREPTGDATGLAAALAAATQLLTSNGDAPRA